MRDFTIREYIPLSLGDTIAMNAPRKLQFTRDQYHRMAEQGFWDAHQRVELIRGELMQMSPKGSRHETCLRSLLAYLYGLVPAGFVIGCQSPIILGESSEPEPDISICCGRQGDFVDCHPSPQQVVLLIEIADSSLEYDTQDKLSLYAEHGIHQYWVFDLIHREVWDCSKPCNNETGWHYEMVKKYSPTDRVPISLDPLQEPIIVDLQSVIF